MDLIPATVVPSYVACRMGGACVRIIGRNLVKEYNAIKDTMNLYNKYTCR